MEEDMFAEIPEGTPPPPDQVPTSSQPITNDQLILKEFILNLEALPELWDSSFRGYKDTIKRGEAYCKLLEIYKTIKKDASVDDVKKKINTLRSNYRKELKKVVASIRSGAGTDELYKPKSWVFHLLNFFNKTEQPINQSTSSVSDTSQSQEDRDQHQQQRASEEENSGAFSSANEILPPPPKQKKKGHLAKQNELLDKACSFLSRPPPPPPSVNPFAAIPMNVTALYWSQKIDKLQGTQKLYAEKYINEILIEAELGNLGRNCVHIYCNDQIVASSPTPIPLDPVNQALLSSPSVYSVHSPTPSPNYATSPSANIPSFSVASAVPSQLIQQYVYASPPAANIPSYKGVPSKSIISRSEHGVSITLQRGFAQEYAKQQPNSDNNTLSIIKDSQDNNTAGSLISSFRPN